MGQLEENFYTHYGNGISNDGPFETVLSCLFLFLFGLFIGFGQWVAINVKIKKTYNWIFATQIGFMLGSFIGLLFIAPVSSFFTSPIFKDSRIPDLIMIIGSSMISGLITGACQWVSLRTKVAISSRWPLVMALSFEAGYILEYLLAPSDARFIIFSITVGLISGIFAWPLIIQKEIQLSKTAT